MKKVIYFLFPALLLLVLLLLSRSTQDVGDLVYAQSAMSICIYAWTIVSWRGATGRFMDAYTLFATAAFLFNAGQTVLYCTGALDELLKGQFSHDDLFSTLTMVNVFLISMHVGALTMCLSSKNMFRRRLTSPRQAVLGRTNALRVGVAILLVAAPAAALQLRQAVQSVYDAGYFVGLYQQTADVGADAAVSILAQLFVPAALFMLAGSRRGTLASRIALLLLSMYVVIQFFLGLRGSAIVSAAAAAWLWNKTIRKLRPALVILSLASMTVILPLIGAIRDTPGSQRTNISYLVDAYRRLDNPTVALISEMGNSMYVNAQVLQLVPSTKPFDYGMSYAYGVLTVVPNFFWPGVHPGAAHSPSKWLIGELDPFSAARGGGIGFTFLAEAYINFGLVAGAFFMAGFGALLATGSMWAQQVDDPGRNALVAVTLCFLLLYARAELGNLIRWIAWYGIAPYGAYKWLMQSDSSKLRLRRPRTQVVLAEPAQNHAL
jgi:oligosaccharide repeat unit polymerase